MASITIRPATVDDVPLILYFIQELAAFEKLATAAVATEDALRGTLFGPRPYAETLIASCDGEPAGFALFFHTYSTFLAAPGLYLEDLFVKPEFRSRGIGRALMIRLAQLTVERNCGRFEWSVLNWNEHAIRFYRSLGAAGMADWTIQRVEGAALTRLAAESSSTPTAS